MSENPHYIKAVSRLHNGTNNEVARAHVEATLAVAFEQRTANLIAMWSKPQSELEDIKGNPVTYSIHTDKVGELLQEIIERLSA